MVTLQLAAELGELRNSLVLRETLGGVTGAARTEDDRLQANFVGTLAGFHGIGERFVERGARSREAELAGQEAIAGTEWQRRRKNRVLLRFPGLVVLVGHEHGGDAALEEVVADLLHQRHVLQSPAGTKKNPGLFAATTEGTTAAHCHSASGQTEKLATIHCITSLT